MKLLGEMQMHLERMTLSLKASFDFQTPKIIPSRKLVISGVVDSIYS